jgi:hypothetical protein
VKKFFWPAVVFLLASPSSLSMPLAANLGDCNAALRGRDGFYNYMCKRNDGSIGWLYTGGRIGFGSPIFAIANRDTDSAFLILKDTTSYPGFYCYYNEPSGLNRPSTDCLNRVRQMAARARKKVFANCSQLTVGYSESNEIYRFWELDGQRDMYWLPAGSSPSYANGEPLRMAGGTDSLVTTAFATLCPSKFRALGARTGN